MRGGHRHHPVAAAAPQPRRPRRQPLDRRRRRGRRPEATTIGAVAAAGALAVLTAFAPTRPVSTADSSAESSAESPEGSAAARARPHAAEPRSTAKNQTLPRAEPVRLAIPAVDIHARDLVKLRRRADGHLDTPRTWNAVGWYADGPWPGQAGTAVMVGHVDSHRGPAIFHRLGKVRPDHRVTVRRADGTVAEYTVYAVEQHPKNRFPTDEVYSPSGHAELRLITCGGQFDRGTDSYRDNIIAYAKLTAVRNPPQ